jgi:hypothetical protein
LSWLSSIEDLLESSDGTDITVARRGLADSQDLGGFSIIELLEMAQSEDFAVDAVHRIEGFFELQFPFGSDSSLAGSRLASEELFGEYGGGCLGEGAAEQGDLSARVSRLGPQMASVELEKLLDGQESKPEEERHGGIGEVVVNAIGGIQKGLLDDIGGIDSATKAAIHSERDDTLQSLAMVLQSLPQGTAIPMADLVQPRLISVDFPVRFHKEGPLVSFPPRTDSAIWVGR